MNNGENPNIISQLDRTCVKKFNLFIITYLVSI